MKRIILCLCLSAFFLSCNNDKTAEKTETPATGDKGGTTTAVDLPYKAEFSSSFTDDVSDADLKMVLTSYKDWSDANMNGLGKAMGDTVRVEMSNGDHWVKTNADLMKMWSTNRDSLSSVKIQMTAWRKMYATDKKLGFVVTWYDETDTYKTGKVDSASYQDVNGIKDGKITYYSQYKRPKK
jgi:ketosteroid isomerase-like protein